jgi:putative addiction module CopG family antidote
MQEHIMTINLPADVATFVKSQLASGAFQSPDEVLRAAVQSFKNETERSRQENKLRQMLQAGADQVRDGQTLDVDDAFDEIELELFGQKLADE